MTDRTSGAPEGPPDASETSFGTQLSMMWRAFMASPVRNRLIWIGLGLIAVIVVTALGQVVLNRWNRPFYDAIEKHNLPAFLHQLVVFAEIASVLLALNVVQTWLNQLLHIKLREGLVRDLIDEWMRPRRAFSLANAGAIGVNPDQRLHEDARHLADLSADLGIGLLQATILLVSFIGVLWTVSEGFVFHISGRSFAIPGYMVWAGILYAGTASWLSWAAGRPLIRLNSERYAREAELRFSFMRVNEHVDAIAMAGGEPDEKRRLELDLASVLQATQRIMSAVIRLTWVTAGYGWITVVAPIVIASPIYFAGDLSFGGLMMAAAAFTQVHNSLHWFVGNIGGIADWRATLLRVASFRAALLAADQLHDGGSRIVYGEAEDGRLTFDDVAVASPGGDTRLSEPHVAIAPGERVLIRGSRGAGKTLFFRAIAGLWPEGSGRIGLPAGQPVTFVPGSPYFPPGTLRAALSYPLGAATFPDGQIAAALTRIGIGRLAPMLDRDARWDRELGEDEQLLLAFARLALHRPRWVVIDEALDDLRGEARRRVLELLAEEMPDSAIVAIGEGVNPFFTRTIGLLTDGKAEPAPPPPRPARPRAPWWRRPGAPLQGADAAPREAWWRRG